MLRLMEACPRYLDMYSRDPIDWITEEEVTTSAGAKVHDIVPAYTDYKKKLLLEDSLSCYQRNIMMGSMYVGEKVLVYISVITWLALPYILGHYFCFRGKGTMRSAIMFIAAELIVLYFHDTYFGD